MQLTLKVNLQQQYYFSNRQLQQQQQPVKITSKHRNKINRC